MWYEIKQKQQKMPKTRADINVCSSTRCSSSSLISSCLTVSFTCGIVYSRVKRTPESEKKQMSVYLIKRKIQRKCWYTYQVRIYIRTRYVYIPFSCSTRGRCELPFQQREVIFEDGKSETRPKHMRTWLTRRVLPHTGDQARSVE